MAKTTRRTTTKKKKPAKTTRKKSSKAASRTTSSRKTSAGTKKKTKKKVARAGAKATTRAASKKTTKAKSKAKSTKKTTRGMTKKKKAPTTKKKSPAAESKKKSTAGSKKKAAATTQKGSSAKSIKRPRSVAEAASNVAADEKGYVFINGRRVRMISTRGMAPVKKARPAPTEVAVDEDTAPSKPLKTRLSKKELTHYRNLLLIKRAEIVGDLDAMEAAALRSSGGNISHMPIHMADIGTDTYDQDFTLGLAESERRQLREIDEALQRIDDRTYGVCQMTGNDIPKARLDAKPWAKYTIEAARLVESQTGNNR